jgi:hypothetical protein
VFRPHRQEDVEGLCATLGWKIFTIDADATMHFSN